MQSSAETPTFLLLSSFFKGNSFIEELNSLGERAILLTKIKLGHKEWARHALEDMILVPDLYKQPDITNVVSYLARSINIQRIVPLDDLDLEIAANLREHLRLPGLGESHTRYFRDKLAMRKRAVEIGLPIPNFAHTLHYPTIFRFLEANPAPWVLKPRGEAGAIGIKKLTSEADLWKRLDELGDRQSHYILEQFIEGDVYHVDSIVFDQEILYSQAHKYGTPPLSISQNGGVFCSYTLDKNDPDALACLALNKKIIGGFGLTHGVTHIEFLKNNQTGQFFFLEAAARPSGAHLADLIEAHSGINPWREWARLESALVNNRRYELPQISLNHACIMVCLSHMEGFDYSQVSEPELTFSVDKPYHFGVVFKSEDHQRIVDLMKKYYPMIENQILAIRPPIESAHHLDE